MSSIISNRLLTKALFLCYHVFRAVREDRTDSLKRAKPCVNHARAEPKQKGCEIMKLELVASAAFGLEAVVRREIEALGYRILRTEDGKVYFLGDERAVCRSNLWLRSSDRVGIALGEFKALEFEELFQQIKGLSWEEWIPLDGRLHVNGASVKSKLSSVPAIQSVSEKAVLSRLSEVYGVERFEKSGAEYSLKISLLKDRVSVTLDTTGESLHNRGYRRLIGAAPLKETTAAAMLYLSFWKPGRILIDPCCGSGTIPIEAAMMAKNIAPGISRSFAAEKWDAIPKELWKQERANCYRELRETEEAPDGSPRLLLFGSDIDPEAIKIAKKNAEEAGVEDMISFTRSDASRMGALLSSKLKPSPEAALPPSGVVVTNPPYGQRIGERESIDRLYSAFKDFFSENGSWSLFALTADKDIEKKAFGRQADRRRKLYNGRLEVCYYQFHGAKPQKAEQAPKEP